ncbi:MAG: (2Fe-2S)-binding protein [Ilumatobacteraceae bacterium]
MALVCLCHGVGERRVRREIDRGARSIDELADRCRAGSGCHGCHPTLEDLLAERCADVATVAAPAPRRRFRAA